MNMFGGSLTLKDDVYFYNVLVLNKAATLIRRRQSNMAEAEYIQPLVCDNGTGMVKVPDAVSLMQVFQQMLAFNDTHKREKERE